MIEFLLWTAIIIMIFMALTSWARRYAEREYFEKLKMERKAERKERKAARKAERESRKAREGLDALLHKINEDVERGYDEREK